MIGRSLEVAREGMTTNVPSLTKKGNNDAKSNLDTQPEAQSSYLSMFHWGTDRNSRARRKDGIESNDSICSMYLSVPLSFARYPVSRPGAHSTQAQRSKILISPYTIQAHQIPRASIIPPSHHQLHPPSPPSTPSPHSQSSPS